MTDLSRTPPDSDATLIARIAQATRPAPLTPAERARFAARVRERVEDAQPRRPRWLALAACGGLAAAALAALLVLAPAPPLDVTKVSAAADSAGTAPSADDGDALADSWEEEVLYAPEWIEHDEGFVDAELLPANYAVASALLEP